MVKQFTGETRYSKGIEMEIGDGKRLKIYHNCQLPRPTTFKPFSPSELSLDSTVFELIVNDDRWKELLIEQDFMGEDVRKFKRTRVLHQIHPHDILIKKKRILTNEWASSGFNAKIYRSTQKFKQ